jgi:hypothetical protein
MIARLIFRILTRPILAACQLLETPLPADEARIRELTAQAVCEAMRQALIIEQVDAAFVDLDPADTEADFAAWSTEPAREPQR